MAKFKVGDAFYVKSTGVTHKLWQVDSLDYYLTTPTLSDAKWDVPIQGLEKLVESRQWTHIPYVEQPDVAVSPDTSERVFIIEASHSVFKVKETEAVAFLEALSKFQEQAEVLDRLGLELDYFNDGH